MKAVACLKDPAFWAGCLELEVRGDAVRPWRGRLEDRALYPQPLIERITFPAGVRLVFQSDTSRMDVRLAEVGPTVEETAYFDLVVDGELHQTQEAAADGSAATLRFTDLPAGMHRLELYLTQCAPVWVDGVSVDDDAEVSAWEDPRPKWLTHGSSITMCRSAVQPTATWPALVASELDVNHTNLGFGGQCKVDALVARAIAKWPADAISLCLGINVYEQGLTPRTFRSTAAGFILTVRDGHPEVPLVICSPIYSPPRETTVSKVGNTLCQMREDLATLVDDLRSRGDEHLHYVNGLDLYGPDLLDLMPDKLHPNREGCAALAKRFVQHAGPKLGLVPAVQTG